MTWSAVSRLCEDSLPRQLLRPTLITYAGIGGGASIKAENMQKKK